MLTTHHHKTLLMVTVANKQTFYVHFKKIILLTYLKKLSKNSLSNLTPHPTYVVAHYSHPTLLEWVRDLCRTTY